MPKKKPIARDQTHLLKVISDGTSALLIAKSILAGYLKKHDEIRIELDDLCRRYQRFQNQWRPTVEERFGCK